MRRCKNQTSDVSCICQSCTDARNADKIASRHVPGKRCKNHNQCAHCCYIVFLSKILRHYGNACSKNSKCPVCQWNISKGEKHSAKFYLSETSIKRIQRQLLCEGLGVGYGKAPWRI
jgi:hypothetical protein